MSIVNAILLIAGFIVVAAEGKGGEPCMDIKEVKECRICCADYGYSELEGLFMVLTGQCHCKEEENPCKDQGHNKDRCETCCANNGNKIIDNPFFEDFEKCRCVSRGTQVCQRMLIEGKCNECCKRNGMEALPRTLDSTRSTCVCLSQDLKRTIMAQVRQLISQETAV